MEQQYIFKIDSSILLQKKKNQIISSVTGVISLSPYTDGNTNLFTPGCHRDIVSSL